MTNPTPNKSANPYDAPDMNPFAEQLSQPKSTVTVNINPQETQPTNPSTTGDRMEFYNPSGQGSNYVAGNETAYQPPSAPAPGTTGAANQFQQPQYLPPQPPSVEPDSKKGTSKFWKMEFYQQFFDVDTKDVLTRMANVLVPIAPPDFLLQRNWHFNNVPVDTSTIDPRAGNAAVSGGGEGRSPDLYGPFWVCTTLWIALAIVGNMMSKLAYKHGIANRTPVAEGFTQAPIEAWKYDFTQASVACVTIYCYCAGMALILWALMKWKAVPVTFIDTLCLYGYSMFIFLLAAILCVIPISWTQWLVCFVCGLWSTAYLLLNFWHAWKSSLESYWFIGIVAIVFMTHMLITLSFKFYFFNYKDI